MDTSAERVFMDWRAEESCFFTQPECERWLDVLKATFSQGAGYAFCRNLAEVPPPGRAVGQARPKGSRKALTSAKSAPK